MTTDVDDLASGDSVRVSLRNEPGSDRVVHRFEGEVRKTRERPVTGATVVDVRLAFGITNSVTVPTRNAEFEVLSE